MNITKLHIFITEEIARYSKVYIWKGEIDLKTLAISCEIEFQTENMYNFVLEWYKSHKIKKQYKIKRDEN